MLIFTEYGQRCKEIKNCLNLLVFYLTKASNFCLNVFLQILNNPFRYVNSFIISS